MKFCHNKKYKKNNKNKKLKKLDLYIYKKLTMLLIAHRSQITNPKMQ